MWRGGANCVPLTLEIPKNFSRKKSKKHFLTWRGETFGITSRGRKGKGARKLRFISKEQDGGRESEEGGDDDSISHRRALLPMSRKRKDQKVKTDFSIFR